MHKSPKSTGPRCHLRGILPDIALHDRSHTAHVLLSSASVTWPCIMNT